MLGISHLGGHAFMAIEDEPVEAPAAPEGLAGEAGDGQITWTWTVVGGVTYTLYHAETTGVTQETGTAIASVTSPYVQDTLDNDVEIFAVLTATNAGGESEDSVEASATPEATEVPAAPENLAGEAGDAEITWTWDVVGGVTYTLYFAETTGVTQDTGTPITPVTSPYVQDTLVNDTEIFAVLTATNGVGESEDSVEASATPVAGSREITPITLLASAHDSSNNSDDYVTTSAIPVANRFQLLAVMTASTNGVTTPTGVTGAGVTWESVGTPIVIGSGTTAQNLSLWRALGAGAVEGALTVAYGAVLRLAIAYAWVELGGADTGGTNGSAAVVQQDTATASSGGDPTATLAAFEDSSNLMVVVAGATRAVLGLDGDFTHLTAPDGIVGADPTSGLWVAHALSQVEFAAVADSGATGLWAFELKSEG